MGRLDEADVLCARMAEAQHGVFTLSQALKAGHNKRSIHKRIDKRAWRRVLPTVFACAGTPATWEGEFMAAALWDVGRAFVSGPSAAFLYGVPGFSHSPIEISTVSSRNPPTRDLRVRRVHRYALNEIGFESQIPVASPRWTVLDLAGQKHRGTERALSYFLRTERVRLEDLWDLMDRDISRGRRGIRVYRELVGERTLDQAPTQSELEDMYRSLVRDFSLPEPVNQWPVVLPTLGLIHFDFGYPWARLAIEVDGYAWHMDREAFERDRLRDMEAQLLGIKVIRLTWSMLKWKRSYCADLVRSHLALSSASSVPD